MDTTTNVSANFSWAQLGIIVCVFIALIAISYTWMKDKFYKKCILEKYPKFKGDEDDLTKLLNPKTPKKEEDVKFD